MDLVQRHRHRLRRHGRAPSVALSRPRAADGGAGRPEPHGRLPGPVSRDTGGVARDAGRLRRLRMALSLAVRWRRSSRSGSSGQRYARLDWRFGWPRSASGAALFALWLGMDAWVGGPRDATLEDGLAALPAVARLAWIATRAGAAVLTVPMAEELAFRGYLPRRLVAADFEAVSFRSLTPPADPRVLGGLRSAARRPVDRRARWRASPTLSSFVVAGASVTRWWRMPRRTRCSPPGSSSAGIGTSGEPRPRPRSATSC